MCHEFISPSPKVDKDDVVVVNEKDMPSKVNNATFDGHTCQLVEDGNGDIIVVPVVSDPTVAAGYYALKIGLDDGSEVDVDVNVPDLFTMPAPSTVIRGAHAVGRTTSHMCPAEMAIVGLGVHPIERAVLEGGEIACETDGVELTAEDLKNEYNPTF